MIITISISILSLLSVSICVLVLPLLPMPWMMDHRSSPLVIRHYDYQYHGPWALDLIYSYSFSYSYTYSLSVRSDSTVPVLGLVLEYYY